MDVSEQAEEKRTAEAGVPEGSPETLALGDGPEMPVAPPPLPPLPARPVTTTTWLRLAYALEFWIALIAILTGWSEVAGQGHMDLVAWYLKLSCAVALAWSGVKMTAAMAENPRAWNRSTFKWLAIVLVFSSLVIGITYWYHLHEVPDEPDTDENSATSVSNREVQKNLRADTWSPSQKPRVVNSAPGPCPASRSNILST